MADIIMGLKLPAAYKLLKDAGYNVTAFYAEDNWFRAETKHCAIECEFDGAQYICRASDC